MPGAQERKGGGLEQAATGMVHAGLVRLRRTRHEPASSGVLLLPSHHSCLTLLILIDECQAHCCTTLGWLPKPGVRIASV